MQLEDTDTLAAGDHQSGDDQETSKKRLAILCELMPLCYLQSLVREKQTLEHKSLFSQKDTILQLSINDICRQHSPNCDVDVRAFFIFSVFHLYQTYLYDMGILNMFPLISNVPHFTIGNGISEGMGTPDDIS